MNTQEDVMRAYAVAEAGDRVLITGGLGSVADAVAAVAALAGHVCCEHALRGTACSPRCRVLRGGPQPAATVNRPLRMALSAWTTEDVDRVVPWTLHCWFDTGPRVHRSVLLATSTFTCHTTEKFSPHTS